MIDALQVIEELIRVARDLRDEPEDGLTKEEAAFYDALADSLFTLTGAASTNACAAVTVWTLSVSGGRIY